MDFKLLLIVAACMLPMHASARAEVSVEDLLKEAESALESGKAAGGSVKNKQTQTPNALSNSQKERLDKPAAAAALPKNRLRRSPSAPPKPADADTGTALKPLENPQIDEIVSLEVQYNEAEKQAASNYAAVSVLASIHSMGKGFAMEKDEDVFTVNQNSNLAGMTLQLNTPRASFSRPGSYWGYVFGARAGFFLGDVGIARTGVMNESRSYRYQMIPVDLYATLSYRPRVFIEFQLTAGAGADFYYQKGEENVDTLSGVGTGVILSFATYMHLSSRVAVVGMVNQRGLASQDGNAISGTTVALGAQFGLFL